jgi:hypothetical protein
VRFCDITRVLRCIDDSQADDDDPSRDESDYESDVEENDDSPSKPWDQPAPSITLDVEDEHNEFDLSSGVLSPILASSKSATNEVECEHTALVDVQMVEGEKGGSFELGAWV